MSLDEIPISKLPVIFAAQEAARDLAASVAKEEADRNAKEIADQLAIAALTDTQAPL
jgi:hypothetical protein